MRHTCELIVAVTSNWDFPRLTTTDGDDDQFSHRS